MYACIAYKVSVSHYSDVHTIAIVVMYNNMCCCCEQQRHCCQRIACRMITRVCAALQQAVMQRVELHKCNAWNYILRCSSRNYVVCQKPYRVTSMIQVVRVSRRTVFCSCPIVLVGLKATLMIIVSPLLIPPCMPPDLLVLVRVRPVCMHAHKAVYRIQHSVSLIDISTREIAILHTS
jgi:hypothetical protein